MGLIAHGSAPADRLSRLGDAPRGLASGTV